MGGDEVLQDVEALAEVRGDRRLDDRAVRLGHQAAHAGQLADLRGGTARTRVGHHVDGVERLLLDLLAVAVGRLLFRELRHHDLADFVAGLAPDIDHLVVALAGGHEPRDVLLLDLLDFLFGALDQARLFLRHQHVVDADRDAGARGQPETGLQQLVGEDDRLLQSALAERGVDQLRDLFLLQRLVQVRERQALRQNLGKERAADRGIDQLGHGDELASVLVLLVFRQAHGDLGGHFDLLVVERTLHFRHVGEDDPLALGVDAVTRGVVETEHDVLRRHDRRLAVGREQHVVRRQHQRARFHLSFDAQRNVHGHLVAVEVGVEGGADQRMQLDRLAFDQHRLERLDAQAVQRRCAVQQHRVFLDDFLEDVPDHRRAGFDFLLRCLDRRRDAHGFEAREDERLEELERHQFRQAALMQLERRADDDDRTAGVVDALAQQVLAETTRLALDHVGERLEGTLVGAGHGLAATTVVEQRVDGFLQHPLLVADDDLRRLQLEQPRQAVVAVDNAAIQVVQVGGREAAAVERGRAGAGPAAGPAGPPSPSTAA